MLLPLVIIKANFFTKYLYIYQRYLEENDNPFTLYVNAYHKKILIITLKW